MKILWSALLHRATINMQKKINQKQITAQICKSIFTFAEEIIAFSNAIFYTVV